MGVVADLLLQRFEAAPADAFGGLLRVDHFGAVFQLAITAAAAVALFINLHQFRYPQDRRED